MAENNSNSFAGDFPDLVYFPPFAGGGTPAFVGDDTPDIEGGTANNNQTDGNGNWYFSSDNTTTGNGNWYIGDDNTTNGNGNWNFGSGNTTNGNGNWYIGDDNTTTGNGNRPSGSNNDITGNGNRPSGDGNVITGNRHETSEDHQNIVGNSDRYFSIDSNGNMTLVSDGTSNGDRSGYPTLPEATSATTNSNGGETMNEEELNDLLRDSPFGRLLDIPGVEGAEDIFGNLGGGNPFGGGGEGGGNPFEGGNPFGGGEGGGMPGDNPWAGWNPTEDGNPFDPDDDITGNDGNSPIAGGDGIPLPGEEISFELGENGYFLRDGEGNWYFSTDNVIGDGDTSLGAGSDSFINADTFFGEENPFGFITDGSFVS
ncbi:MAG: hypothetical protein MUD14_10410 [Hydrococcus sp. Prado102]|jgi:hypothetical protein|nr:hypothetical protein [Hydrococcus sp. Prado102]